MRIISEKKLREFCQAAHGSERARRESAMQGWKKIVRKADWTNFAGLRQTFNHADIYGICTVFDVGGNKYRIIGKVVYRCHAIYMRFVLTHNEYDEKKWQSDCK